jgi:hypothetical protein
MHVANNRQLRTDNRGEAAPAVHEILRYSLSSASISS